jgi:Lrp/AsnC family leucine-responsive transcriptional regulator
MPQNTLTTPKHSGMSTPDLDTTDRKLLTLLQADARMTVAELAEAVALSPSPCWRRIRALEATGLIAGYHARLDRKKLGYGVTGFVHLQMATHAAESIEAFERELATLPQVLSCHNLSGHYDYLLEVIEQDLDSFAHLVRVRIRGLPGVREISTAFSLKEVKRVDGLPVNLW